MYKLSITQLLEIIRRCESITVNGSVVYERDCKKQIEEVIGVEIPWNDEASLTEERCSVCNKVSSRRSATRELVCIDCSH